MEADEALVVGGGGGDADPSPGLAPCVMQLPQPGWAAPCPCATQSFLGMPSPGHRWAGVPLGPQLPATAAMAGRGHVDSSYRDLSEPACLPSPFHPLVFIPIFPIKSKCNPDPTSPPPLLAAGAALAGRGWPRSYRRARKLREPPSDDSFTVPDAAPCHPRGRGGSER